MKLGFIGTGNMAKALIEGFNYSEVYVSNKTEEKALEVCKKFSANFCKTNIEVCEKADIIFLCVKPNTYKEVLTEISPYIEDKIIVSIAAGITIDFIKQVTQDKCKVVRTMPNTPAQVLCGMTGICFDDKILKSEQEIILNLFKKVGSVLEILEEQMHGVVALSGSSPAYAYMFIDALAKAGVELGFDYEQAVLLASSSLMGASKMVLQTGISPEVLTKNVCSKGGTTIEGVAILENKLDRLLMDTAKAVYKKSEILTKN